MEGSLLCAPKSGLSELNMDQEPNVAPVLNVAPELSDVSSSPEAADKCEDEETEHNISSGSSLNLVPISEANGGDPPSKALDLEMLLSA